MPGMKKAARRRRQRLAHTTETELPQPFFEDGILGTAWGTTKKEGAPILMVAINGPADQLEEYVRKLRQATLNVVRHEAYLALVVVADGRSLGRLTTSLGSPLAAIVAHLESTRCTELGIGVASPGGEAPPIFLEVFIQEGIVEDFEPVVIGHGDHVCACVNVHTGVWFHQRFASREEAEAQRERNEVEDRPFVGSVN